MVAAGKLGIIVDEHKQTCLDVYLRLLQDWNGRVRLVSDHGFTATVNEHFLDSLQSFASGLLVPGARVVDVGSGAGFPGMACAIAQEALKIVLIEATAKKAAFLTEVKEALGLENVTVYCLRAEQAGRERGHREAYDVSMTRAVGQAAEIAELCLPLVKIGGHGLFLKGRHEQTRTDIESAAGALRQLGGADALLLPLVNDLTGKERTLVIVEKTATTSEKYPRRPGLPHKRPLS